MNRTALVLMIALVGGILPTAAAADSPPPQMELQIQKSELKGLTRIAGRATSSTVVDLPQPVTVDQKALEEVVQISSTGPIAGLFLRQDARRPVELMALSIDPCSDPPCRQDRFVWNDIQAQNSGRYAKLPAGRYFLYLIAKGGRAEVELRLDGLKGVTNIRPKSPAQSEFGQLDAGLTGAAATPLYRASGSFNLTRFGIAIAALEVEVAPHLAGRYYSCLRPAVEPLPSEAYSLACQGFSSWTIVTPDASNARVRLVTISTVPEGSYAQTAGMQAAAIAEGVSSFGFSLSFDGRDPGSQGFGTGFSYDQRP